MIPVMSKQEAQQWDDRAKLLGHGDQILMERVASQMTLLCGQRFPNARKVGVLIGSGNNGGDAVAMARGLSSYGVETLLIFSSKKQSLATEQQLRLFSGSVAYLSQELSDDQLGQMLSDCDLLIDGLLGVGAQGAAKGEVERLIHLATNSRIPCWAIDVPSGIDGVDQGGVCIKASVTCCVEAVKANCLRGLARAYCGDFEVVSLFAGVPGACCHLIQPCDAKKFSPMFNEDQSKIDRGGVLILAGSERYLGAALLAAKGALRGGAGLVVALVPPGTQAFCVSQCPEAIFEPCDQHNVKELIHRWSGRCAVAVVGPGLDRDSRAKALCDEMRSCAMKQVWDGDGLFALAKGSWPSRCVVTPHRGEVLHSLKMPDHRDSGEDVKKIGDLLAEKCEGVVYKGHRSYVSSLGRSGFLDIGGRELAIPGSGDTLSGLLAASWLKVDCCWDALVWATAVHSFAGQLCREHLGADGVCASDLANYFPQAARILRGWS